MTKGIGRKEFKDTELRRIPKEWEVVKVEDIFEVYGGTTPSTSDGEYWNGDILWVTPTDVTNLGGKLNLNETEKKVTQKAVKDYSLKILQPGTLLLTTRATIGFVAINSRPVAINQGMAALIKRDEMNVDSTFYAYYFGLLKGYLEQLSAGSTFREVSKSTIKKLKIPLPPLPEQRRIAEILSTVDEAIQRVDEAIARTERLKRGLMQELLTKGIGHKEFKDTEIGRIPKEWEVVRLGDVSLDFVGGGTPSTSNPEYWGGNIPWMTSAHISGRLITTGQRYITEKGLRESATNLVPRENILVGTRVGIGKAAINLIDIAISQDLTGIIIKKDRVFSEFVYWALIKNESKLKALAQGSTIRGILREELAKVLIPLPPLPEQRRIAEILSTVDNKLELERERKEKLQRIKRGLMNDLLTGKKRVRLDGD